VHTAFLVVVLVSSVIAVAGVAAKPRISPPLLLVVAGFGMSYLPLLQHFEIGSEIVLIGLLPPLLYSSALRTSLLDFRRNLRPILLLSVGLVAFTVFGVGLIAMWVLPIPAPIAFALGAIVAPPDAVAASAVARRVGMPRRLVTILEGESLVNDATALVALRTAVGAVAIAVSSWHVALDFVWASAGGVLVGLAMAYLTGHLRKRITDVLVDTSISLVTPFVAYLIAEEIGASGVLAVVVAGLFLGHKAFLIQSASGRIVEQNNWRTISFVLENSVFAMIGLQARSIISAVGNSDLPVSTIIGACAAILGAVIVLRVVWMFPATYVSRLVPRVAERAPAPNWRAPVVLSWAGMRGVVTLAAAFSLGRREIPRGARAHRARRGGRNAAIARVDAAVAGATARARWAGRGLRRARGGERLPGGGRRRPDPARRDHRRRAGRRYPAAGARPPSVPESGAHRRRLGAARRCRRHPEPDVRTDPHRDAHRGT